jgi:hypothetical protein
MLKTKPKDNSAIATSSLKQFFQSYELLPGKVDGRKLALYKFLASTTRSGCESDAARLSHLACERLQCFDKNKSVGRLDQGAQH